MGFYVTVARLKSSGKKREIVITSLQCFGGMLLLFNHALLYYYVGVVVFCRLIFFSCLNRIWPTATMRTGVREVYFKNLVASFCLLLPSCIGSHRTGEGQFWHPTVTMAVRTRFASCMFSCFGEQINSVTLSLIKQVLVRLSPQAFKGHESSVDTRRFRSLTSVGFGLLTLVQRDC